MNIYLVIEGSLVRTKSGQRVPQGIIDLAIDTSWIQWIQDIKPEAIILMSNPTWIYSGKGIRTGERFWAKFKYISEVLREELERVGQIPAIYEIFSKKKKWIYGISDDGPSLVEEIWREHPELKGKDSIFVGGPDSVGYAKSMGFTKIEVST